MAQTEEVLFAQEQEDAYNEQPPEIQTNKYLIFSSDGLMYGIRTDLVKDIITDYTITYLPRCPTTSKALSICAARSSLSWISACALGSPLWKRAS